MSIPDDPHTKPLVSVITPCYNGERFITQWADNLAIQDYPNVEVIFVNDGSSDGSATAFQKESERLQQRGYQLYYIEKQNGGAADAVNYGLMAVSGEYLMLLDMDDFLFPENISAKANYLLEHKDVDMVRNNGYMVRENNLEDRSSLFGEGIDRFNPFQLNDLLNMQILPYPGSYMVRAEALFSNLKNRKIYVSPYGQNLQILITVAYYGKAGYIDRPLMKYVNYAKSLSHTHSFERRLELYNGFMGNVIGTLSSLDIPKDEKRKHIDTVEKANYFGRFYIGIEYNQPKLIKEQYKLMKRHGLVTRNTTWLYFLSHLPLGCFAIKSYPRALRVSKRFFHRLRRIVYSRR